MSIQEVFSDRKYVSDELVRMRSAWGYKTTFTTAVIEASTKTLGFMQLYAPEDMLGVIEASLQELMARERLMLLPTRAAEVKRRLEEAKE